MNVSIKDFSISMELGNKGIELEIRDPGGKHVGDLRIGKATIEFAKGKSQTGKKIKWPELLALFED